jgi:hypothetical protein
VNEKLVVLRVATSSIFIVSGLGHLIRSDKVLSPLGKNFVSDFIQARKKLDRLLRSKI